MADIMQTSTFNLAQNGSGFSGDLGFGSGFWEFRWMKNLDFNINATDDPLVDIIMKATSLPAQRWAPNRFSGNSTQRGQRL